MTALLLGLLVTLAPQGEPKSGGIVLPPRPVKRPAPTRTVPRPAQGGAEAERFHVRLHELRRSAGLNEQAADLLLSELGRTFSAPARLALEEARSADPDLMHGVFAVLQRYGDEQVADRVLFLLLTRKLGSATKIGVETLARVGGPRQKALLMQCLTARYSPVRKAATDLLLARLDNEDVPTLLRLVDESNTDVRRKALFLLGALPTEAARKKLIRALEIPSAELASTACRSLIAHGPAVAPDLQKIVSSPSLSRGFGYASFALAALEDQFGGEYLTEAMRPHLLEELRGPDPFLRATSAVALANLAFRSADTKGVSFGDRDIVEGLLSVAAPKRFVSNLSLLAKPASQKLVQFTGQDFRGRGSAWRSWWEGAKTGFVGTRLRVAVDADNGARALLTFIDGKAGVRLRGAKSLLVRPVPKDVQLREYLLSGDEMASLVQALEGHGFMSTRLQAAAADVSRLPSARSLELRLDGAYSMLRGPATSTRWLDALATEVAQVAERERWQLYLAPIATGERSAATRGLDAERVAAWRSEREWRSKHPDRRDRERRLKDHVLAALPLLNGWRRGDAMRDLLSLPELPKLLEEEDGLKLAEMASSSAAIDEASFELLELAVLAPGDGVWRKVLDVIDARYGAGGREVLPRVFGLLGPDRVRAAMTDGRVRIRHAAILEIASMQDQRSVPALLKFLGDPDASIRNAAIFALGAMRVTEADAPLRGMLSEPKLSPSSRRTLWLAIGRIRGPGAFDLLQGQAAEYRELDDKLAAIRAIGELGDRKAAGFLAKLFVTQGFTPQGTAAMAALQRLPALVARAALRPFLGVGEQRVRREVVFLLAEFQDPIIVPDLIQYLEESAEPGQPAVVSPRRVALLLAGITGVDLLQGDDRAKLARQWYDQYRDRPQSMWFLDSLSRAQIKTSLRVEQLGPRAGAGAVPELTRLLVDLQQPHLRVLASAILREVTAQDFGAVSVASDPAQLQAIADRYRFWADRQRRDGK